MTAVGILTLQDRPWASLAEGWGDVKALGFDTVWVADHVDSPLDAEVDWFEAGKLLAALATHTTTIRIGTLVTSMTLRNPAVLARRALTVEHISGGRLLLGLGAGRTPNDHTMTGQPVWPPAERAARFEEFVTVVRSLLAERVTTFHGEHHDVEGAIMALPPVQRPTPPIVVGALGPKLLRVAARHAGVWNTFSGRYLPAASADAPLQIRSERHIEQDDALRQTAAQVVQSDRFCEEESRDPASVRRSFLAFSFYLTRDPWASVHAFTHFVGSYEALGFDEIVFDLPPDDRRDDVARNAGEALPTVQASR